MSHLSDIKLDDRNLPPPTTEIEQEAVGLNHACKKNMAKGNDQIIIPMSGVPIIRLFAA